MIRRDRFNLPRRGSMETIAMPRRRPRTVLKPLVAAVVLACVAGAWTAGCDSHALPRRKPKVEKIFGGTGRGAGEFIYPRAIDRGPDGSLFVADKTGRIQRFSPDGSFLAVIQMPLIESGKPTGLTAGPDGRLYVADTHYSRVMIFGPELQPAGEFGRYGTGDGCFIYPTDVALSGDGRIFVSEFGGNDRVSVFSAEGVFLHSFGSPGSGWGEFSRPAALCVDRQRKRLYVADACNHRIGVYDLDGKLSHYIGSHGAGPGQLRYPYDLALMPDGTLIVCEYGGNRLQLFSPEGESLGIYGGPGRQAGQLAYPWGVTVDGRRRAYVVDAGNNRVQVWQL